MPARFQVLPISEYLECVEGSGPGPRGNVCSICVEDILVSSPTINHMADNCLNVFHARCLGHWVLESQRRRHDGTCPLCRGIIAAAPPRPPVPAPRVQANIDAALPADTPTHVITDYDRTQTIFTYMMNAHRIGWAYYSAPGFVDFPAQRVGEVFIRTHLNLAIREIREGLGDGRWLIVHSNAGIIGGQLWLTFLWIPQNELMAIETIGGYMRESMPANWR